jgi:hypothetical protein
MENITCTISYTSISLENGAGSDYAYSCIFPTAQQVTQIIRVEFEESILQFDFGSGDTIMIKGYYVNNTFNVMEYNVIHGGKKNRREIEMRSIVTFILRIKMPNEIYNPNMNDVHNMAQNVDNTLYNITTHNSANSLFRGCSFGKVGIISDKDGIQNDYMGSSSDIFYIDMPYKCNSTIQYCGTEVYDSIQSCSDNEVYGWAIYARNYLRDKRSNFNSNQWQHTVIIYPTGIKCSFAGMGTIDCGQDYCISWYNWNYVGVSSYVHEIGHNFGLAHAGNINNIIPQYKEYGDFACGMGFCCGIRCYNSPHSIELGWIYPSLELTKSSFINEQHIFAKLYSKSKYQNGTIRISLSASFKQYWLEFRLRVGHDIELPIGWYNNVQIKEWTSLYNFERTDHITTLNTNDSWTDPEKTFKITILSINTTSAISGISISYLPCGDNICQSNENTTSCPIDCNKCSSLHYCMNGGTCTTDECICPSGYSGKYCEMQIDVDECTQNIHTCSENAICLNTINSYVCECNSGFVGNGTNCSNINECNAQICSMNAVCIDTFGSFICKCNVGFAGNGTVCNDINECNNSLQCRLNEHCVNTYGSYICVCDIGYRMIRIFGRIECRDINECISVANVCNANSTCVNTNGSYMCKCNNGFIINGTICNDIDECKENTSNCHKNAICRNTIGSYMCWCNKGFVGDGIICAPKCNTTICDKNAYCATVDGKRTCLCKKGYCGTGKYCTDFNECDNSISNCHINAICINNVGSFTCICNDGFSGDGINCVHI